MDDAIADNTPPEPGELLLTPADVARIMGLTPDAVRALNNKGRLPALKTLGGRRLFRRADVEKLLSERARSRGRRPAGTEQRP
jgi:excisionase family DNA binding protein